MVTSTIAFEGDGFWREYEGGVQDWLTQSRRAQAIRDAAKPAANAPVADKKALQPAPVLREALQKKKLSYKEQRELDALPGRIEALEAEQKAIAAELADGSLYTRDGARAAQLTARTAALDDELLAALERWEALGGA